MASTADQLSQTAGLKCSAKSGADSKGGADFSGWSGRVLLPISCLAVIPPCHLPPPYLLNAKYIIGNCDLLFDMSAFGVVNWKGLMSSHRTSSMVTDLKRLTMCHFKSALPTFSNSRSKSLQYHQCNLGQQTMIMWRYIYVPTPQTSLLIKGVAPIDDKDKDWKTV